MHLYRSSDFLGAINLLVCNIQTPLQTTHNHMPRLIGKSSKAPLYIGTALVIAVAGAIALEYSGVIDIVPNFGKDQKTMGQSKPSVRKIANSHEDDY
jgi:hypothetical protein